MANVLDDFLTGGTSVGGIVVFGEGGFIRNSDGVNIVGDGLADFTSGSSKNIVWEGSETDMPATTTTIIFPYSGTSRSFNLNIVHDSGTFGQTVSSTGGSITFTMGQLTGISEITFTKTSTQSASNVGVGAAEPHVLCLDGSRLELYHNGIYRFFEDPVARVCVNIVVENTFIVATIVIKDGIVLATAHFDIDSKRQLHANFIRVDDSTVVQDKFDIECGDEYTITLESLYRCVVVRRMDNLWNNGKKVRQTLGGALAGIVYEPLSLDDGTSGPVIDLEIGHWDAHALVCDAHFPHIVSFFGASTIPGDGNDHLLLCTGAVEIRASTDVFSRLLTLTVSEHGRGAVRCDWTRQLLSRDAPPSQDDVTPTSMRVSDGEENNNVIIVNTSCSLNATEATRIVDRIFNIESGGEVLVRMQANGAASFAVRGIDHSSSSGLLTLPLSPMEAGARSATAGSATSSSSTYEDLVEPHLLPPTTVGYPHCI